MEEFEGQSALRTIPPVNDILEHPKVRALAERFGRATVTENIRLLVDEYRRQVADSQESSGTIRYQTRKEVTEYIADKIEESFEHIESTSLKRVINATGIILHTNLGRAPLPGIATELMREVGEGYCNLEFDIESGGRGSRHSHIESVITRVTGAESAIIVNNNAAAVFLCLNTLADHREVIISRGQQVEIGGSFRIPDIIARSGAKMKEVGTTNKTRISDYEGAVTEETTVLLKVHTSNYKICGFTEETSIGELAALGREKGLLVVEDLGSGCLYDLSLIGLPYEPTVQDSLKNGADLVTFSGDKLLGGPQAGIIAGKKELIERIAKNPLTRMVRCDKTTIAGMVAVLSLYADRDKAVETIPVLKMLARREEELQAEALELEWAIDTALGGRFETEIVDEMDEVGGGSLPGVVMKGKAVALTIVEPGVNEIQARLRKARLPVICRVSRDRLLLNVRTLEKSDYAVISEALARVVGSV